MHMRTVDSQFCVVPWSVLRSEKAAERRRSKQCLSDGQCDVQCARTQMAAFDQQ
jgi:hypothetical protein